MHPPQKVAPRSERAVQEIRRRIRFVVETGKLTEEASRQILEEHGFSETDVIKAIEKGKIARLARTTALSEPEAKSEEPMAASEKLGSRIERDVILEMLRSTEGDLISDSLLRKRMIDPDDHDIATARRLGELTKNTRNPAIRLVLQRQIPPDILGQMIASGELPRSDAELQAALAAMLEEEEGVSCENSEIFSIVEQIKKFGIKKSHKEGGPKRIAKLPKPQTLSDVTYNLNKRLEELGDFLRYGGVDQDEVNLLLNGYRLRMAERDAQEGQEPDEEDVIARFERYTEEIDRFQALFAFWQREAEKGDVEKQFFQQSVRGLIGVAGMYLSEYDTFRIEFIRGVEQIKTAKDSVDKRVPAIEITRHVANIHRQLEKHQIPSQKRRRYLLSFCAEAKDVSHSDKLLALLYAQTRSEIESASHTHPSAGSLEDSATRAIVAVDLPGSEGEQEAKPPQEEPFEPHVAKPSVFQDKKDAVRSIRRSWEFLGNLGVSPQRWPTGVLKKFQSPEDFSLDDLAPVENFARALYAIVRLGRDPKEIRGEAPLPLEAEAGFLYSLEISRGLFQEMQIELEALPPQVRTALEAPETCNAKELEIIYNYMQSLRKAYHFLRLDLRISQKDVKKIFLDQLLDEAPQEKATVINEAIGALREILMEVIYPQMAKNRRNTGLAIIDFIDPETTMIISRLTQREDWSNLPAVLQREVVRRELRQSVAPSGVYGFLRDDDGFLKAKKSGDPEVATGRAGLVWGRLSSADHVYTKGKNGWGWQKEQVG